MIYTNFESDIEKGKSRETIFANSFFGFFGIPFKDVTNDPIFRKNDIDFVTSFTKIDVKSLRINKATNLHDQIVIEDYTDISKEPKSLGWFYKSKADIIAYCDLNSYLIIMLKFDNEFKEWYNEYRNEFDLITNAPSKDKKGNVWQSAFRCVPTNRIKNFIARYRFESKIRDFPKTLISVKQQLLDFNK